MMCLLERYGYCSEESYITDEKNYEILSKKLATDSDDKVMLHVKFSTPASVILTASLNTAFVATKRKLRSLNDALLQENRKAGLIYFWLK
jgi:hypothetical protein